VADAFPTSPLVDLFYCYYYFSVSPLSSFAFLWSSHATMATLQAHEKNVSGDDSVLPHSPQLSSTNGSSDLDDNYVLYKQQAGDAPADAAESKSVLKKIDWRVLPVLWTLYLLQYLDKNGLNYVRSFLPSPRLLGAAKYLPVAACGIQKMQLLTSVSTS